MLGELLNKTVEKPLWRLSSLGWLFFVMKIYVIIKKSQSLTLMDTSYRKVLLNHRSTLEAVELGSKLKAHA